MNKKINEIVIDGETCILKSEIDSNSDKMNGPEYAIVRSRDHGVIAGYIVSIDNRRVTVVHSRRIWKFVGAETLEEIAVYGCRKDDSKIGPLVKNKVEMLEACGVIYCTKTGQTFIQKSPEWKQ